ncbi:MAG: tyrosine-type recombinase/integrase, partial [Thiobacillus sp.]|nr:tyrosine-type recombinase/integrase [Thiobacillus sp.]
MTPAAVESYLTHLAAERRLSPHTLSAARRDLDKLVAHAGDTPLYALTVNDIRAAVVKLRAGNLAPKSVARHLSSWRGFYAYACRRLGYPANPCVGLRPPKAAKSLPDVLSPDACAQLLDQAPDGALEVRDLAMAELFYSSGLRLGELAGLDLPDLDARSGEARVTGKGSKTRIVPVGTQALSALAAWLPLRSTLVRDGVAALFVNRRGERLSPRGVQLRLDRWA